MSKMSFKKGSRGARKRSEIAEAIHKKHPEYSDEKKFKIATAAAKKGKRRR